MIKLSKLVMVIPLLAAHCCWAATFNAEPGFSMFLTSLDQNGWTQSGGGGVKWDDDVLSTWAEPMTSDVPVKGGIYWYNKKKFGNFILRFDFKVDSSSSNSGFYVRIPSSVPSDDPRVVPAQAYEVTVYGGGPKDQPSGSIWGIQQATDVQQESLGRWNSMEICVIGQTYRVLVNDQLVNVFTGDRAESGYIGLQNHYSGPVHFRHIRIKELSTSHPQVATDPKMMQGVAANSVQLQTPELTNMETLKAHAASVIDWVLSPLDEAIPGDLRRSLLLLREDLLDEKKAAVGSSISKYDHAIFLCDRILTTFEIRDRECSNAGLVAATAVAEQRIDDQQLRARRNHLMNWPQYEREKAQRQALNEQQNRQGELKMEKFKAGWNQRAALIRPHLNEYYQKFRESLR